MYYSSTLHCYMEGTHTTRMRDTNNITGSAITRTTAGIYPARGVSFSSSLACLLFLSRSMEVECGKYDIYMAYDM